MFPQEAQGELLLLISDIYCTCVSFLGFGLVESDAHARKLLFLRTMLCRYCRYVLNSSSLVHVNTPRDFLLSIPTVSPGEIKQLEKRLRENKEKKRKGMFREFVQGKPLCFSLFEREPSAGSLEV